MTAHCLTHAAITRGEGRDRGQGWAWHTRWSQLGMLWGWIVCQLGRRKMKIAGERNGKSERWAQTVNTGRTVTSVRLICRTTFGFFHFFLAFLIYHSLAGVTPINESRPRVNTALASESIPVTCNTNTQKLHLQKINIVLQACPITTLILLSTAQLT